jgi:hypothetical protein
MKTYLTTDEIKRAFTKVWLEGKYDFLLEDLEKLAHEFVRAAVPKIAKEERDYCIEYVESLNPLVAGMLQSKRGANDPK